MFQKWKRQEDWYWHSWNRDAWKSFKYEFWIDLRFKDELIMTQIYNCFMTF